MFFDLGLKWLLEKIIEMLTFAFTSVSTVTNNLFFEQPIVVLLLKMMTFVSLSYYAFIVIMSLLSNTENISSGNIDLVKMLMNMLKGLVAILLVQPITIYILKKSYEVVNELSPLLSNTETADITMPNASVLAVIIFLVILIVTIIYMVGVLKRGAEVFVQLVTHPMYISDLVLGDGVVYKQWLKQTSAIILTNVVSFLVFAIGIRLLLSSGWTTINKLVDEPVMTMIGTYVNFWIGVGTLLVVPGVPKIMQQFGYSAGSKGLGSMAMTANQGIGLVKNMSTMVK